MTDPTVRQQDPAEVTNQLLLALMKAAKSGSTAQDTREVSECAKACLAYAQAIIVLDPTVNATGVPLQHELDMEAMRGQNALEQAKLSASAPTPGKHN